MDNNTVDNDNPFLRLFSSVDEARKFRDDIYRNKDLLFDRVSSTSESCENGERSSSLVSDAQKNKETEKEEISILLENIFLVTVNIARSKNLRRPSRCVYLKELHEMMQGQVNLGLNFLEEAIFERLMLEEPSDFLINTQENAKESALDKEATEKSNVRYLYMCYFRSLKKPLKETHTEVLLSCRHSIITYTRMVLCHAEIYEGNETAQMFLDLFTEFYSDSVHHEHFLNFLNTFISEIEEANAIGEEEVTLSETFIPILDLLFIKFKGYSLVDSNVAMHLHVVNFFSVNKLMAKVFMDHSTPEEVSVGKAYENTLLGAILSLSCLPLTDLGPFEYFDRPSQHSQQEHDIMERNLWVPINGINEARYDLFNRILRTTPEVRHQFLYWLGSCCHVNAGRVQLWTHIQNLTANVSDSFMLNLGNTMLRLCRPFAQPYCERLLKINPTYCAAMISAEDDSKQRGIYLRDLHRETCLISPPEGIMRPTAATYNFTTICFFLTHRTLHLGFNTLIEKLVRLNQELARIQRLYDEAIIQTRSENSETVQNIKNMMERGMAQFLTYKAALLEPNSLELMLSFHSASATWLIHIATSSDLEKYQSVKFPLPATVPLYLSCIPEFIIDNVAEFVIFLRRFSSKTLELAGEELEHLMTLILVFMGNADRIKNPHLRAKLAEMLEALMPHQGNAASSFISLFHREKLFGEHKFIHELVPTLLNVFVSIEMTGQSVAFEQKFNYRRPMYIVMDYIWKIEIHRETFKSLAVEAEQTMESTTPPLFLRFINLLINDAIFLLDEALTYMTRLREQQQLRDSGGLRSMPPDQRQQNESNFQHMGNLARFHNVMGNSTIHILELLTQEIKSIFTHRVIVDRIAAMLNYFLLHLVGPKKKQLKVKDLTEYEFKPHELVRDICFIYLHLGESKEFCKAVSRDGRSYSADLFHQAEQVLNKIGHGALVAELEELAGRILELAARQLEEDEALGEAPEEFIDPIMGTVMGDPVILPSSKVTVDRATIARHLLSDQTDPFNRSALSMDMVVSNVELKKRIEDWLKLTKNTDVL